MAMISKTEPLILVTKKPFDPDNTEIGEIELEHTEDSEVITKDKLFLIIEGNQLKAKIEL